MISLTTLNRLMHPSPQPDAEIMQYREEVKQEAEALNTRGQAIKQDLVNVLKKVIPEDAKIDANVIVETLIDAPFHSFHEDVFTQLLTIIAAAHPLPNHVFACSSDQLECLIAHTTQTPTDQQKITRGFAIRGCIMSLVLHFYTQENDPLRAQFTAFIKDHAELTAYPVAKFLKAFKLDK